MAAVFLGGMLCWLVTRHKSAEDQSRIRKRGILLGSGLVGGEGLMGVGVAIIVLASGQKITGIPLDLPAWITGAISLLAIAAVLYCIARFAKGGD